MERVALQRQSKRSHQEISRNGAATMYLLLALRVNLKKLTLVHFPQFNYWEKEVLARYIWLRRSQMDNIML
jgi:hypothetical protein